MPGHDREAWREKLAGVPERPGVYLMEDAGGTILYVGKAVNLRNRLRSYFQDRSRLAPKVAAMMRHVADFELITTDTEVEALILEATLIKRHRPHYNIRLKDDKAYPYLRLTWEEDFPRLVVARRVEDTGSRYFGPYTRAQSMHETVRLLRSIFPIRNCTNRRFQEARRPCLEYHIRRCQAPCVGLVDRDSYRAMMKDVELFLDGKADQVEKDLLAAMTQAAERMEFERAARLRDQLKAVREVTAQQKVAADAGRELDAIAWVTAGEEAFVQVFTVRGGRLIGRQAFTLTGLDAATTGAEIGRAFLTQYYDRAREIPAEVLVPVEPAEAESLRAWLAERRGGRVALKVPRRGEKAKLLAMVEENARLARDEEARRLALGDREREEALTGIQQALGLAAPPRRMECYDISHTQGQETVASMVVFTDGRPDKSQYRRFRVRGVSGPDDFASMAEVIRRRFEHARLAGERPELARFARRPDLILIDGGKGQLSAAWEAMHAAGEETAMFGLAKEHEWLFAPGEPDPIILDRHSPALRLLMHLRDEAHRFAITYHRQLRGRRSLRSLLDEVPDIGPKRKRELLTRYRNLEAVRAAPLEELAALPGMTRRAAERVKDYLAGVLEGPGRGPEEGPA
ncbi:UvrABC system protein C [Candidatus Hydrogenisulfobacillus filiaventi]|uniref:UvrABC system protein C n=1 Tax=Candidatus Hydrogenisulfobacillus filiaventi TaxID=2707344 RepID=A0A6F8ZI45_9FIRM|nr:excinuclease ABC subunit UvrC [Bacillota bacterium]CAB1129349.1 UvrABC system protein C [Candidatus Hydrogenisulfobacillus filiaventi]